MINRLKSIRRSFFTASILVLLVFVSTQSFADDERYIKINRSIELFGRVYQELINNYVDEVDPEKLMRAGIDGMLEALDPYTVYIDERGRDEVDLLTTGRYGGVGVTIGTRNGAITITAITEGYSAEKQGLMIGDRIIMIDDTEVESIPVREIRSMVRGEPGTSIKFTVEREGYNEPIIFPLVRESVRVHNVSFADFVDDGIVYIRLDRFSRGAGGETRQILRKLQEQGRFEGVILDLRDNSGGLLDAAVEVANIFVPRGSLIVSTRGRTSDSVRRYSATQEPMLPDVPLIVLINNNSASASEIVAGAIQDLDRGVIVGTRSFGKGLVQTVANLRTNAQLKITTSRYYTPSGRSIQTADYLSSAPDGLFAVDVDSLHTEYKTKAGRVVYEGRGVEPDTTIVKNEQSRFVEQLNRRAMLFSFATKLVHSGNNTKPVVDDEILNRFMQFLNDRNFRYKETSEEIIDELRKIAERDNYPIEFFNDLKALEAYITEDKVHAFERHREEIIRELNSELASRYNGSRGRIVSELETDIQFIAAVELIKNKPVYKLQLSAAD